MWQDREKERERERERGRETVCCLQKYILGDIMDVAKWFVIQKAWQKFPRKSVEKLDTCIYAGFDLVKDWKCVWREGTV